MEQNLFEMRTFRSEGAGIDIVVVAHDDQEENLRCLRIAAFTRETAHCVQARKPIRFPIPAQEKTDFMRVAAEFLTIRELCVTEHDQKTLDSWAAQIYEVEPKFDIRVSRLLQMHWTFIDDSSPFDHGYVIVNAMRHDDEVKIMVDISILTEYVARKKTCDGIGEVTTIYRLSTDVKDRAQFFYRYASEKNRVVSLADGGTTITSANITSAKALTAFVDYISSILNGAGHKKASAALDLWFDL